MSIFQRKQAYPTSLNICLIAYRFKILSRSSDTGFLWPIARGLAKLGHKVTIISTTSPLGKPEVQRDGVRAYFLHEGSKNSSQLNFQILARSKFLQLHKESPFHIVHSLDAAGYRIGKMKRQEKFAMAYDVEATQMSQLFSILGMKQENFSSMLTTAVAVAYKFLTTYYGSDRKILRTADGIFVTNPQQRIILERYYLYPDMSIYQVPYGLEIGDLSPKDRTQELRQKYQIPSNAHVAVTISEMTDVGEIRYVLEAFERVVIKKPTAHLILIGSGPAFKDIEFQVLNLALGNRVLMVGSVAPSELPDYISAGDVFINMSSRTTGFEPSSIEAMAQKKVLIGSEVSPLAHIVADGQDGFLVRPADVESMAQLMIEIFSGTLPAQEMGERARQKVIDLFDTQRMLDAVLKAYEAILTQTGRFARRAK